MTRPDLLAYAASEYSDLLAEAEIPATDGPEGLKYPIDLVEAAIGGDYAAAGVGACYALTDYHVIARIARAIAARVDAQTTGFAKSSGQQVFDRLALMMKDARERVESYGYNVGGDPSLSDTSGLYTIVLDIIEPQVR